ncbi:head scaffolding protein [Propionibacterium phage PHL010M04]|uniref:Scaffold protein n=4 Tax=Pahexavirus TaxID=1982251 RepID=A0A0E3DN07_9CAUD|nr:head scaffolding protein [Propionibacterium phage PHL010M04]YP_009148321.1 head scaffolding protein [Propionibacterium phage PHL151M00]YP_009603766.1 head scaffolding protein [Propionibacterium phage PHL151N00]AGI12771.1 putative scaffold protein [Propionibacterium phage PHL066M04]AGI12455.1 putative scaffold protein [Propionibacterium phage PHL010M04]AII29718.1 scaffold protein [Propionibacterium phage PHL151M00]AII29764.1 scaffold protein [Propionibacterium phage PHL151N00]
MADQNVEEQNVDKVEEVPEKGDVVDVVKDDQSGQTGDQSKHDGGDKPSGTDWKAEARKWESRAKSNFAELEKLRASDGDAGSTIDELRRKNEELEDRINGFVLEGVKREVAAECGLSADAVAFLSGGDRESLAESAKALKGLIDHSGSGGAGVRRLAGSAPVDDVKRREGVAFVDALVNNSRR